MSPVGAYPTGEGAVELVLPQPAQRVRMSEVDAVRLAERLLRAVHDSWARAERVS